MIPSITELSLLFKKCLNHVNVARIAYLLLNFEILEDENNLQQVNSAKYKLISPF